MRKIQHEYGKMEVVSREKNSRCIAREEEKQKKRKVRTE